MFKREGVFKDDYLRKYISDCQILILVIKFVKLNDANTFEPMESMIRRLLITIGYILSTPSELLFPLLREVWGVIGNHHVVCLEYFKHALFGVCLENALAFPFVRFLSRKVNHTPSEPDMTCICCLLTRIHLRLLQNKWLAYDWRFHPYIADRSNLHFKWHWCRCSNQCKCHDRPLHFHSQIWHFPARKQGCI